MFSVISVVNKTVLLQYHTAVLTETIGAYFSAEALKQIIRANHEQDTLFNLLTKPHIHFDNCLFADAANYIEEQHALIARSDNPLVMRGAFGRLSHTAQDFYSHSNYVDLWLGTRGGLENTRPDDMDGLDPALLASPELRSGYFHLWRDSIYYLPLVKGWVKKHLLFPDSHETMHLDDPGRGPKFPYSIIAAKQRTLAEYRRAVNALDAERASLFHGK